MTEASPDVVAVKVVSDGVLVHTFEDGVTGQIDVLERLCGPIFELPRIVEGFAQVHVDPEIGTIPSPNGADLAPDTLYGRVATGRWYDAHVTA